MSTQFEIRAAASKALDAAKYLRLVNGIFLALTVVGAFILIFLGFTADDQASRAYLSSAAFASLISATLLFALVRAIAIVISLAGTKAMAFNEGQVDEYVDESSSLPGEVRSAVSDTGCMACGSRNLQGATCSRCGGEATEFETTAGWYVTTGKPERERYFDGRVWSQEYRDATRFTLDKWDAAQPGWLQDPRDPYLDRFWDGRAWTAKVRDAWGDNETEASAS